MAKHLQMEIGRLKKRILHIGAFVEEGFQNAVVAVTRRDAELAQRVLATHYEVDVMEVDLEEECLKILALYQPVARREIQRREGASPVSIFVTQLLTAPGTRPGRRHAAGCCRRPSASASYLVLYAKFNPETRGLDNNARRFYRDGPGTPAGALTELTR